MSKDLTLQKWLPQGSLLSKKRVVIYDFDNTLFNSPGREEGEVLYLEGTGNLWPFGGWWGRIETLMPPIVPDPIPESMWIASTLAAYREDQKDKDAYLVMMTGRPFKCRKRVREILDSQNIVFHEEFYRGMKGQRGSDTLEIKLNIIEGKALGPLIHNSLEVLEIWEDRPEHSSRFMTEAKRWKSKYGNHLRKVIIHDVLNQQHHEF